MEHSAIFSTIKLPFVTKIFVSSIFDGRINIRQVLLNVYLCAKTVWILIRWLHQKPAGLDLHYLTKDGIFLVYIYKF